MLRKMRGRKKCYGALKIDMSKANNSVDWKFLKVIFVAMNFSSKWANWILEYMTTVHYTLLVNGSLTQSFKPDKGLRQGKPYHPISSSYVKISCRLHLSMLNAKKIYRVSNWVEMGVPLHICCLLMIPYYSSEKITNPLAISEEC